jgi:hypothetical protein
VNDKTHWKRLMNPDYIGAYWLPPGEDVTVVIDFVVREMITGTGGKKEECTVAHLKGVKPFILNATNSKSIAKLYGPYIEDWAGKPITLYASTAKLAGDTVECLRVRPKVAERVKPPITETRLDAAIDQILAGAYTTQKLHSNFDLTAEQRKKVEGKILQQASNELPAAMAPETEQA